jgi:TRAP-type C4-dicarboxylate transport system substrate-binding protein
VLTLADHEQGPDQVQAWIEEVQRRVGGSLRIQVTNHWRDQEFAYVKATISDVQAGKVALAKVAARAYDTVGIDSFQALVAPLLIDNPTLEGRVLESDLATKMLAGTDELGLVGLVVLPTDLRKPLGVTRPLVRARDYRGAAWAWARARSPRRPSPPWGPPPCPPSPADRSGAWTGSTSTWAKSR